MEYLLKSIHLISLSFFMGGMFFFTLFIAPAIFGSFPRERAGEVMGVIFPRYFLMGYIFIPTTFLS